MSKRIINTAVSVLLCVCMLLMSACTGNENKEETTTQANDTPTFIQPSYETEAKPADVKKSETVYVSLNPDGSVASTVITDWLHTDKAEVKIRDKSSLKNIENVKSEVLPVFDGEDLVWNMNTTDLYYSGTTDKKPDVDFSIKYTLDGKELTPKELAGKSGHLKIEISVKNNKMKTVSIDGNDINVYNPVVVVGGFILPEENYSGISVTDGRLIGDGTKQIAVFAGLPGFKESLGLTDEQLSQISIDLPESYSVEADVKDCSLGNMLFSVMPLNSLNLDLGLSISLGDVSDVLTIVQSMQTTFASINADKLIQVFTSDPEKIGELSETISKTINLYNNNKALIEALMDFMTTENLEAVQKLVTDLQGVDAQAVIDLLENPVFKILFNDLPALAEDLKAVMPAIEQLNTALEQPEVSAALENLPQTIQQLSEVKGTLEENEELVNQITEIVSSDALGELSLEMSVLSDMLNGMDINVDLNSLVKDSDALVNRLNAWLEYSDEYTIFTDAVDGMQSSVMFIYETASVSAQ